MWRSTSLGRQLTQLGHEVRLIPPAYVKPFVNPSWAKSQSQHADLDLSNIILATLPQPILVQMIRTGGVALGNLTLDVSRGSGFYPDIFMGYPERLRQLRQAGVIEPQARFFCKNRGVSVLVRKGNPLGIHSLADAVHTGAQMALPDSGDVREKCRAAAEALLGKLGADALFAAEVPRFPGRLGIMHRDLPEMIARAYADGRHHSKPATRLDPTRLPLGDMYASSPMMDRAVTIDGIGSPEAT